MKKILIGILAIIMVLGIVGCSSTPETKESNTSEPTEKAPVETENQEPELTVEPTQTEASSSWQIVHYVDDFGDETNEVYLQGVFTGEFSNTATSNSDLTVIVGYDYYIPEVQTNLNPSTYSMSFRLLEYNDHKATFSNSDTITLKAKIDDSVIEYNLAGTEPNGDLVIVEKEKNYRELPILTTALEANKYDIPCIIQIGSSKYSFKLSGSGFAENNKQLSDIKNQDAVE